MAKPGKRTLEAIQRLAQEAHQQAKQASEGEGASQADGLSPQEQAEGQNPDLMAVLRKRRIG